jgi:hypothetical protein
MDPSLSGRPGSSGRAAGDGAQRNALWGAFAPFLVLIKGF